MAKQAEKLKTLNELKAVLKRIEKLAARPAKSDEIARETDLLLAEARQALAEDAKARESRKNPIRSTNAIQALTEYAVKNLGYVPKSAFREYVESIGAAVLIALILRGFVVEAFKIPTGSMIPTLLVGDHIFVNKFVYGIRIPFTEIFLVEFERPERGEVVVFTFPVKEARQHVESNQLRGCIDEHSLSEPKDFIKRIIGLPGDMVEIREGRLRLNGTTLPRELLGREPTGNFMSPLETRELETSGEYTYVVQYQQPDSDFGPVKVKEGHFFVMGDHRDNSSDSRCWGQVPMENVKGRSMFIWLSLSDRAGETIRWDRFGKRIHASEAK